MSTYEGASAAEPEAAPALESPLLTCPNCGRTVAESDLVRAEYPEPWVETVSQAEMDADMAEFGIPAGAVGPAMTRIVRLECIGCVHCAKPPVKVTVH
jgi:dissimilatory sulfite reductase (desulfoviridin) alpha/beta subunit